KAFAQMTGDSSVDPQTFLGFLDAASSKENSPNHNAALQARSTVDKLSELFANLKLLGLNDRELIHAKVNLVNKVKPSDLTTKQLYDIVEFQRKYGNTVAIAK